MSPLARTLATFLGCIVLTACPSSPPDGSAQNDAGCPSLAPQTPSYCLAGSWVTRADCEHVDAEDPTSEQHLCVAARECPGGSHCGEPNDDGIGCCVFWGPSELRVVNTGERPLEAVTIHVQQDVRVVGSVLPGNVSPFVEFDRVRTGYVPYVAATVDDSTVESMPFNDLVEDRGIGRGQFDLQVAFRLNGSGDGTLDVEGPFPTQESPPVGP